MHALVRKCSPEPSPPLRTVWASRGGVRALFGRAAWARNLPGEKGATRGEQAAGKHGAGANQRCNMGFQCSEGCPRWANGRKHRRVRGWRVISAWGSSPKIRATQTDTEPNTPQASHHRRNPFGGVRHGGKHAHAVGEARRCRYRGASKPSLSQHMSRRAKQI